MSYSRSVVRSGNQDVERSAGRTDYLHVPECGTSTECRLTAASHPASRHSSPTPPCS